MLLPLTSEKLSLDQQSLTSAYPIPEKRALSKTALYGVVIACVYSTSLLTICPQHPPYVRSSGTANVQFPRILTTSIHTPRRCLCNCLKAARNITGRLLICMLNIYHGSTVKIIAGSGWTARLPVWLSCYHCCHSVEPHKRRQPCTEPADPQHTCTVRSKNRIYLFDGFEFLEC
ncbi:hypothetical protein Tsp_01040 [Trichinella spiralis]|uniref:hypothetical protein n=1 Tax=Trichinella spiralis TaxID=6334 RepID=UPI0001EFBE6C|nr:hypothetical protein Tsp_01040 [Trichinella spiralis]